MEATPIEIDNQSALKELRDYQARLSYDFRIGFMEEKLYKLKVEIVNIMIAHFEYNQVLDEENPMNKHKPQKGGTE